MDANTLLIKINDTGLAIDKLQTDIAALSHQNTLTGLDFKQGKIKKDIKDRDVDQRRYIRSELEKDLRELITVYDKLIDQYNNPLDTKYASPNLLVLVVLIDVVVSDAASYIDEVSKKLRRHTVISRIAKYPQVVRTMPTNSDILSVCLEYKILPETCTDKVNRSIVELLQSLLQKNLSKYREIQEAIMGTVSTIRVSHSPFIEQDDHILKIILDIRL